MAQGTEKEETEYKIVPENISLCGKCGVGCNAANNLCPKCFSATGSSGGGAKPMNLASADRSVRSISATRSSPERESALGGTSRDLKKEPSTVDYSPPPEKRVVNRCSGCRRRVGLTGFRCRCGELFCAEHRYSDRHDCSYDYKSFGRKAIARENPVVKAAKIIRI